MEETRVDIASHRSKGLDEFLDIDLDYVVTVCDHAKQTCPLFPGEKKVIHRGFKDPAALSCGEDDALAVFRRVRDVIRAWIKETSGTSDQ